MNCPRIAIALIIRIRIVNERRSAESRNQRILGMNVRSETRKITKWRILSGNGRKRPGNERVRVVARCWEIWKDGGKTICPLVVWERQEKREQVGIAEMTGGAVRSSAATPKAERY
jgi:hypothetical protein